MKNVLTLLFITLPIFVLSQNKVGKVFPIRVLKIIEFKKHKNCDREIKILENLPKNENIVRYFGKWKSTQQLAKNSALLFFSRHFVNSNFFL